MEKIPLLREDDKKRSYSGASSPEASPNTFRRISDIADLEGSGGSEADLCPCPPEEVEDARRKANCPNCGRKRSPEVSKLHNFSITVQDDSSGEHCHDEGHLRSEVDRKARRKLWIASILCVFFMVGEAVGGVLAGSLAVATDAAHLLTDFAGFMISLFALYIAQRPATKHLSYGYHRAEVIGALTSVLLIWVITGILVYLAVERVMNQTFEIDAVIMLITSGVGVAVNIVMGLTLHQHPPGSHGHSHCESGHSSATDISCNGAVTTPSGKNGEVEGLGDITTSIKMARHSKQNINVRAAFIHVLGDFIQSIGVFVAALVIYFKPTWVIVDPICTFLFSFLVLGTTYAIVKDALVVLMEGIPKGIDFNDVRKTLLEVKGVCKVHNLRIWALSMEKLALSAHLAVDPNGEGNANIILRKSSHLVKRKYGFSEVTIQIEDFNQRMQDCLKCQELN